MLLGRLFVIIYVRHLELWSKISPRYNRHKRTHLRNASSNMYCQLVLITSFVAVSHKINMLFGRLFVFPSSITNTIIIFCWIDTSISTSPPPIGVAIPHRKMGRQMHHGTQPTHELSVDKAPRVFPQEVLVVEIVVVGQEYQVVGKFLGRLKLVNVDETVGRERPLVFFVMCTKYNWDDTIPAINNIQSR